MLIYVSQDSKRIKKIAILPEISAIRQASFAVF